MGYAVKANGAWRAVEDGMILAADETYSETLPEPKPEQVQAGILASMDMVVENWIQQQIAPRHYMSIERAPLYISDPDWGAEAQTIIAWNSAVWKAAYKIMDDCLAGKRAIPTTDELIAELPAIVWPA